MSEDLDLSALDDEPAVTSPAGAPNVPDLDTVGSVLLTVFTVGPERNTAGRGLYHSQVTTFLTNDEDANPIDLLKRLVADESITGRGNYLVVTRRWVASYRDGGAPVMVVDASEFKATVGFSNVV